MRRYAFVFGLLAFTASPLVLAGVANDIPSCYAANKMTVPAPATEREIFVMVDQTTQFDASLQDSIREHVGRLVTANSAFVIADFSSFAQGRYLEVLTAGTLEGPIDTKLRDDLSVKILKNFDACLSGQLGFGRKTAAGALNKALSGSASDIAKSDILGSLKELSARIRESKAKDRILFLASDMLENSSVTSFYGNHTVRTLDPASEIKKVESAQMLADFGGARVFILGAGLMQENAGGTNVKSGIYRDPKTVNLLREFWNKYFNASKATLEQFGAPALLSPVR